MKAKQQTKSTYFELNTTCHRFSIPGYNSTIQIDNNISVLGNK